MRVGLVYDMDACKRPTGVTRHALAQIDRLRKQPDVELQLLSGRITEPDGLAYWESLGTLPRWQLPATTRNTLRWWRLAPWPPVEWWTRGPVDWIYSPAEYFLPVRRARVAVTSHDILQDLRLRPPRYRDRLAKTFDHADLILSVSKFNTDQLLNAFPSCEGRVAWVPNGADDLFFEPCPQAERDRVHADLSLPPKLPYLLSVANFQPRKNLERLIRAAAKLPEAARGELALVLLGEGAPAEEQALRAEIARLGGKLVVRLPGYRQDKALRAVYAEALALVFPSTCESFGIPAVEAMAQGTPVVLANSTALPEIGEEAGWYFDPEDEAAITSTLSDLLAQPTERARKAELGRSIAQKYRWQAANDRLVEAFQAFIERPRRSTSRASRS